MPTISCKDLEKYLNQRADAPFAPVYLIFGEEMLVKSAFDKLLDALVPVSNRNINYEPLDGTHENIHAVIAQVPYERKHENGYDSNHHESSFSKSNHWRIPTPCISRIIKNNDRLYSTTPFRKTAGFCEY